jgi:hypothetical protein
MRQRAQDCLERAAALGSDRLADHLIALAEEYDLWARHFDENRSGRQDGGGNPGEGCCVDPVASRHKTMIAFKLLFFRGSHLHHFETLDAPDELTAIHEAARRPSEDLVELWSPVGRIALFRPARRHHH